MTDRSEILVIGGGVIGLAIALELRLRGATVTVLTRNFAEAASHAAAGMLAPQAEQIPAGAMQQLCLRSREQYAGWATKLEALTGLDSGYWACGILAPRYSADADAVDSADWLDRAAIHQHQPGLSEAVVGGYWYPKDAQVNNRLLAKALWTAVQDQGVQICEGAAVQQILHQQERAIGVQTAEKIWQADHYILATGAWSQNLLPVPVHPRKGQMLSVRVPADAESLPLQTVLFGEAIYIVPRRDGQILLGATSEDVGFAPANTPAGIQRLLDAAIRLFPPLQNYPIQEMWWGFRPATPDELPILGESPYRNLTLATGHYRNGILLTPVTAELIANWVWSQTADPLLSAFHWSRFSV